MIIDEKPGQDNLLRQWSQPMAQEAPSFSAWSFTKSGVKGLPMAGLEVAGSWADLLSGFATPYAATFSEDAAARKKMLEEGSFDFSAGNVIRAKADEFAPDPLTSHRADQVISSLTRTMGKAVGYIGTMGGIPGAVAFGADEGNTAAQRLMEKGVDPTTAAQVGGVTGVVSAGSALIPVAGKTLLQTAGLVGVSGPGLYVAQESLAKRILQEYPQEAETHDPTDPLGLALSIAVPSIAGGLHMRSVAKAGKVAKGEAAMKAEATLTPDEQARSDAFERSDANIRELRQAIDAEKNAENKKILQAELDKQVKEAQAHAGEVVQRASRDPDVVDSARVKVQEDRLQQTLPDVPYARSEVMRAVDDLGSGEQPKIVPVPDFSLPALVAPEGAPGRLPAAPVLNVPRTPTPDEMSVLGRVEDVSLDQAYSTQRERQWVRFSEGDHPPPLVDGFADKPVAVKLRSGEYLVLDGHHRSELALQRGDMSIPMHVIDAADYDPQNAGRPRARETITADDLLAELLGQDATPTRQAAQLSPSELVDIPDRAARNNLPVADVQPMPAKMTPEAARQAESSAVQSLATETPDMRVSIPGHEAMSVAEAIETAKAEAAEIKSFGELVKAAVQCALQNGLTA